ncbi:MAG: hypothetical protein ACKVT2_11900 [Saprospiraceae bacterium]
MVLQKSIAPLFCFLLFSQTIYAQWSEEIEEYLLQSAALLPIKSISAYSNGTLKRTYNFDFYKRYTGYDVYDAQNKVNASRIRSYDENGYLIEETAVVPNGAEEKICIYRYDSLGNQIAKEECSSGRCFRFKTEFDSERNPIKEYIGFQNDSTFWLKRAFLYDQGRLIKTEHYGTTRRKDSKEVFFYSSILEYSPSGQKTCLWLEKGSTKKMKTKWEYDRSGNLSVLTIFSVHEGSTKPNTPLGSGTILDDGIETKTEFFYDKKGRISATETSINGTTPHLVKYKYN